MYLPSIFWLLCLVIILTPNTLFPSVSFGQEGPIEIVDVAPQPSERQKKKAEIMIAKGVAARNQLVILGNVLRAQRILAQKLESNNTGMASNKELSARLESWEKSLQAARANPQDVKILKELLIMAVHAAQAIGSTGPADEQSSLDVESIQKLISASILEFREQFDQMVLRHGLINKALSSYPYSVWVAQPFIECQLVNEYSRDFRCLPINSISSVIDPTQFCPTKSFENFSQDEKGNLTSWVRKGSLIKPELVKPEC